MITKTYRRDRIRHRIKKVVSGTAERPRLSVFKSNNNIYIQAIDDLNQKTLASSSTLVVKDSPKGKVAQSEVIGKAFAVKLNELKIDKAVFDRGSYKYHGRIKSLADGVRSGGIKF